MALVYLSGLAQGVAVVMTPSLANVLRSPTAHALSDAEYGGLFLPFIALAIAASMGCGAAVRRLGARPVYLIGLASNALAMLLIAASALLLAHHALDRAALLVASGALGVGFGTSLTSMNAIAPRLFPARPEAAVTALHALLGVGTVLPALVLPVALSHGGFQLLPLSAAALFTALVPGLAVVPLPAAGGPSGRSPAAASTTTARPLWGFAAAAAFYGLYEALIGNWGVLYLHEERGLSTARAGVALATFWASVTAGRALVAALTRVVPARAIYVALPLVAGTAFAALRGAGEATAPLAFAVAGLGCSAFLPLTISFAAQVDPARAESAAGLMLAAFMGGQGVSNTMVGFARGQGRIALGTLFAGLAVASLLLAWLAASLARPQR